jgi:membrane-associated phospholipid phosphatase
LAHPSWTWVPPALLLLAAAVVAFTHSNKDVFLWINGWSDVTGENYWALLTIFSDGVVSFALMLPWIRRRPESIWALLLSAVMLTVLSQITKHTMDIPRPPRRIHPDVINVIGPTYVRNSFPSGHASMAFAMASVWSLTCRTGWVRLSLLFAASLVALSRVVVGVHWPLDVAVGAAVGWLIGWAGLLVAERTPWGYRLKARRLTGGAMLVCGLVLFFPYCGFTSILWEQRTLAAILLLVGAREYAALFAKDSG